MSDDPINSGSAMVNQPQSSAAAGTQPDPLAGLQSAIDAAKAGLGDRGQIPVAVQSEEDPEKVFIQTIKDAVKKLEASQSVTSVFSH